MDKIEVTQADREAAAIGYYDWVSATQTVPNRMQAGEADFHSMVQAFARHRLATRTDATPVAEVEALRGNISILETALQQIAGTHAERFGRCQTDVEEVPDLSAEEAVSIARNALEATGDTHPPATDVAALVEAAKDLRDAIAHMAAPARVDPDKYFSEQVKAFGDAFGYGALMTTASALWRQSLGDLQGGEFAVGPCVTTAANQLNRLYAALAPFTKALS